VKKRVVDVLDFAERTVYQIRPRFDLLIVFALGALGSFALSPSLTDSLGTTSYDDGPVQPALAIKDPSNYEGDLLAKRYTVLMWTSSTKWIPALLYKYLSIDPVIFHFLFTQLQTILILVGSFLLARALTSSRAIAYLSVFFVINLSPYFDNFAWYGDQFFMPYPTWCAIGPILIGWSYALEQKNRQQFSWLVVGCSIHPAMGLCGSTLILVSTYRHKLREINKFVEHFVFSFSPAILFSSVSWFISKGYSATSAPDGWKEGTKEVVHWFAWKLVPNTDESLFQQTSYAIILFLTSFVLLHSSLLRNTDELRVITRNSLIVFGLFYAIQAIGYSANIRSIYSFSFGRISIFTSIFAVIILAKYLIEINKSEEFEVSNKTRIFITILLLIPSFFNLIFIGLITLWNALKMEPRDLRKVYLFGIYIILTLIFLLSNFSKSWFGIPKFWNLLESTYLVPNFFLIKVAQFIFGKYLFLAYLLLIAISLYVFFWLMKNRNKKNREFLIFSIVIVLTLGTFFSRYVQSRDRAENDRDWIKTQVWVRDSTSLGSKFILDGKYDTYYSWTTLSKRARILSDKDAAANFLYIYSKDDEAFQEIRSKLPPAPSLTGDRKSTEEFYLKFSQTIGGDYLVRRLSDTPLSWKPVYENAKFKIYRIPLS
jgi:hypothetical protein